MNKFVRELDINKLLFIDIETASQLPELDPKSELFKIFQYKHRDRETEKLPTVKETQEIYKKTAALSPVYNMIVAFGISYVKDNQITTKILTGDEKDILTEAYKIITDSKRLVCGFNSTGFDLPTIRVRASTYNIQCPEFINDCMSKPWIQDEKSPDLLKIIQGTGYSRMSLDEACYLYQIKSPKNTGVKGSEVSNEYHTNGIERIKTYLEADMYSTVNLFLRLQGKPIIE